MSEVIQRDTSVTGRVLKRFVQIAVLGLAQAVILFVAAGRLDWWNAWLYMAFYIGLVGINAILLLPRNKELIAERANLGKNTKTWDKRLSLIYGVFTLLVLLVAGLDARFLWSPPLHPALLVAGGLAFVGGFGLFSWAMVSNKFFSSLVRIQTDRSHQVSTGGPYRYVRHPGYVGLILSNLGTPLFLGSYWAMVPAIIAICLIVLRTSLEDRTLQKELSGYKEFASHTRYRLIPGVW